MQDLHKTCFDICCYVWTTFGHACDELTLHAVMKAWHASASAALDAFSQDFMMARRQMECKLKIASLKSLPLPYSMMLLWTFTD